MMALRLLLPRHVLTRVGSVSLTNK